MIPGQSYIYVEKDVKYCGPISKFIFFLFIFLCFPIVPFIYYCPCDVKKEIHLEKEEYVYKNFNEFVQNDTSDEEDDITENKIIENKINEEGTVFIVI